MGKQGSRMFHRNIFNRMLFFTECIFHRMRFLQIILHWMHISSNVYFTECIFSESSFTECIYHRMHILANFTESSFTECIFHRRFRRSKTSIIVGLNSRATLHTFHIKIVDQWKIVINTKWSLIMRMRKSVGFGLWIRKCYHWVFPKFHDFHEQIQ
jgi:hypothetical protein